MKSIRKRSFRLCLILTFVFVMAMVSCSDDPTGPDPDGGLNQNLSIQADLWWTGVLLTWNRLDRVYCSAYLIQRSALPGGDFETTDTVDAFGIAYVDKNLDAGATYCYRLVALDNCGQRFLISNLDTVVVAGSSLYLSDTTCLFDAEGGVSDSIWVRNGSLPAVFAWAATKSVDWLSLTATSGLAFGGFTVNANANTSGSNRSGLVVVTAEGIANSPDTLRVAQAIPGGILCPSSDEIEVPPLGGVDSGLTVYGCAEIPSCRWTAQSDADWLTLPAETGTAPGHLYLNAAMNNTGEIRSCTVTVAPVGYDDPPDTVIVTQGTPFNTHVDYIPTGTPSSVWCDDLEGDGDVDLIVTYSDQTYVDVFRNNGDGTFAAAEDHEVGGAAKRIRSADLDGDGDIDLVAVFTDGTTLSVHNNDGDGNFTVTLYNLLQNFGRLCLEDCDGDGDVDVISTNRTTGEVLVIANNGDATLSGTIVRVRVGNGPEGVDAANINNLGNVDLVVANSLSSSVSLVVNNGGLTYSNASSFMVEATPVSICCLDFNNDYRMDLATTCSGTNRVRVLNNTGNTGSGRFATVASLDVVQEPTAIYPIDLNLDGRVDLAVGGYGVSVLVNRGGSFATGLTLGSTSEYVTDLCTGDFDGDGDEDLAAANNTAGLVTVYINRTR